MTGASKRKGDRAELEVANLIRDLLGYPARRQFGAGTRQDIGDIAGVPNTTVQVANWVEVARAALTKPRQTEAQRLHAGTLFAATFVRFRGGAWRVVLTPEQWATLLREAQPLATPAAIHKHRPQ